MRGLFGRRRSDEGTATAVAEPPARFDGSDVELEREIARLTERARDDSGHEQERTLIRLRNVAGIRRLHAASGTASFAASGSVLPAAGGLPEVFATAHDAIVASSVSWKRVVPGAMNGPSA